jgi:hypothetical protein
MFAKRIEPLDENDPERASEPARRNGSEARASLEIEIVNTDPAGSPVRSGWESRDRAKAS